jgi:hypothetical protein
MALSNQTSQSAQNAGTGTTETGSSDNTPASQEGAAENRNQNQTGEQDDTEEARQPARQNIFSTPIMEVGDETLYWRDYVEKRKNMIISDDVSSDEVRDIIVQNLINESVTLQEAETEGHIDKLDDAIYNTPTKDYEQRSSKYIAAQAIVDDQAEGITGSIVSLWFYNAGTPAEMGYEEGKDAAIAIISGLHEQVADGTLTMYEAAEQIMNDPQMAQIDTAYRSNAYLAFSAKGPDDKITYDPEFDDILRDLPQGELTDVYIGKDDELEEEDGIMIPTGEQIDAIVMFGQVTEKSDATHSSFTDWVEAVKDSYSITIYDDLETLISS